MEGWLTDYLDGFTSSVKSVNSSHNWSALSRTTFFLHMFSFRKEQSVLRWYSEMVVSVDFILSPAPVPTVPKMLTVIANQNTCTGGFRKAKGTSYCGKYQTWFYRMNLSKWISRVPAWVTYGGTELQPVLSVIFSVLIDTLILLWCTCYSFACSPCNWDLDFAGFCIIPL